MPATAPEGNPCVPPADAGSEATGGEVVAAPPGADVGGDGDPEVGVEFVEESEVGAEVDVTAPDAMTVPDEEHAPGVTQVYPAEQNPLKLLQHSPWMECTAHRR